MMLPHVRDDCLTPDPIEGPFALAPGLSPPGMPVEVRAVVVEEGDIRPWRILPHDAERDRVGHRFRGRSSNRVVGRVDGQTQAVKPRADGDGEDRFCAAIVDLLIGGPDRSAPSRALIRNSREPTQQRR